MTTPLCCLTQHFVISNKLIKSPHVDFLIRTESKWYPLISFKTICDAFNVMYTARPIFHCRNFCSVTDTIRHPVNWSFLICCAKKFVEWAWDNWVAVDIFKGTTRGFTYNIFSDWFELLPDEARIKPPRNCWNLGMDKYFHPTFYWACNYFMLGLKLNLRVNGTLVVVTTTY